MKVIWLVPARDDRRRIAAWLKERNPTAAIRITRALTAAAASLGAFPMKGRPGRVAGTRELSSVQPYVLIYEVDERSQIVHVLRVWHSAQDRT